MAASTSVIMACCASPANLDPRFAALAAFVTRWQPRGYDVLRSGPEGFSVMDSYATRFPLPENWPCGVKTAVVHAIALAHVAIVLARRLVLNSPNARTRLDGELRRVR